MILGNKTADSDAFGDASAQACQWPARGRDMRKSPLPEPTLSLSERLHSGTIEGVGQWDKSKYVMRESLVNRIGDEAQIDSISRGRYST